MMNMTVKTSSGETYSKEIVSVNFYQGNLIIVDSEGKTSTYTKESLESNGDQVGMISIL